MPVTEGIFPFFMLMLLTLFAAGVSLDAEAERRRGNRSLHTPGPSRPGEERR